MKNNNRAGNEIKKRNMEWTSLREIDLSNTDGTAWRSHVDAVCTTTCEEFIN